MTSRRAKMIIAFVWILSFLVSFPPLLGWAEVKDTNSMSGKLLEVLLSMGIARIEYLRASRLEVTEMDADCGCEMCEISFVSRLVGQY